MEEKIAKKFCIKVFGSRINDPILETPILHYHVKFSQIELYVILLNAMS